ncbi:Reverse transcriptase domain-containing protein, partial [Aphis craccivora]
FAETTINIILQKNIRQSSSNLSITYHKSNTSEQDNIIILNNNEQTRINPSNRTLSDIDLTFFTPTIAQRLHWLAMTTFLSQFNSYPTRLKRAILQQNGTSITPT